PMKSVLAALGLALALALANYWVLGQLGGPTLCGPCAAVLLGGPFVLALALAGILPALAAAPAPEVAAKPAPVAAPKPSEPPAHRARARATPRFPPGAWPAGGLPHRGGRGLPRRAVGCRHLRHPAGVRLGAEPLDDAGAGARRARGRGSDGSRGLRPRGHPAD